MPSIDVDHNASNTQVRVARRSAGDEREYVADLPVQGGVLVEALGAENLCHKLWLTDDDALSNTNRAISPPVYPSKQVLVKETT